MPKLISRSDLPWQRAAFCKLAKTKPLKGRIVWARVGEGKSRVALRLAKNSLPSENSGLVIIICSPKAFYDWQDQVLECGYDWKVEPYEKDHELSIRRVSCLLVSSGMLHKHWAKLTHYEIDYIIYDELYGYSNSKARRTKAATALTSYASSVVGISGTIMPARNNETIWGQCASLGLQSLLARNITQFRERFRRNFLLEAKGRKFPVWSNAPKSDEQIQKKLADYTYLHFPKNEHRSILQKISRVDLTVEQRRIIKQLKVEYYADLKKGNIEIRTALELVIQIQRISNGYVFNTDGEIETIKTNKFSALNQSVSELVECGQQCLIWCAFREDVRFLQKHLEFASLQMLGGTVFDIDAWKSGKFSVVIATEGSGQSVNHFSNVQYAKYFSHTFRWVDLQQSQGRNDRKNSKHSKTHYEHFLTRGTLDDHAFNTARQSGATEKDFIKSGELTKWMTQP